MRVLVKIVPTPPVHVLLLAPCALALGACATPPRSTRIDSSTTPDVALRVDAAPPADAAPPPDTAPPPLTCDALDRLAAGALAAPFRARQAAFAPDLDAVAIVEHRGEEAGDLIVVDLPSRETRTLATAVGSVDWIDREHLIASVSVFGLRPMPGPFLPGGFNVELHRRDGGEPELLFAGACGYTLAADRSAVLGVHGCVYGRGTLSLRDLSGGVTRDLATDAAYTARLSPDGRRVAFFSDVPGAGACEGALRLVDLATGEVERIAQSARHARFVPGALVYETCGDEAELRSRSLLNNRDVSLGPALTVRWGDTCPEQATYAVSPDGTRLLGSRLSQLDDLSSRFQLLSVHIDGSDSEVLAEDPLPYPRYAPFAFSGDGTLVLYLRAGYGLGAVPLAGGEPRALSERLSLLQSFAQSPGAEAVAYLERRDANTVAVVQTELAAGAARLLYAAASQVTIEHPPEYLPDGRGLLWAGGRGDQLIYVPAHGDGAPAALGALDREAPLGCLGYVVDPTGCVVLFNDRDRARIAQLPR